MLACQQRAQCLALGWHLCLTHCLHTAVSALRQQHCREQRWCTQQAVQDQAVLLAPCSQKHAGCQRRFCHGCVIRWAMQPSPVSRSHPTHLLQGCRPLHAQRQQVSALMLGSSQLRLPAGRQVLAAAAAERALVACQAWLVLHAAKAIAAARLWVMVHVSDVGTATVCCSDAPAHHAITFTASVRSAILNPKCMQCSMAVHWAGCSCADGRYRCCTPENPDQRSCHCPHHS